MTQNLSHLPWTWAIWVGIIFMGSFLCTKWSKNHQDSRLKFSDYLSIAIFVVFADLVRTDMKAAGFNYFQALSLSILVYIAGVFLGLNLPSCHK